MIRTEDFVLSSEVFFVRGVLYREVQLYCLLAFGVHVCACVCRVHVCMCVCVCVCVCVCGWMLQLP